MFRDVMPPGSGQQEQGKDTGKPCVTLPVVGTQD